MGVASSAQKPVRLHIPNKTVLARAKKMLGLPPDPDLKRMYVAIGDDDLSIAEFMTGIKRDPRYRGGRPRKEKEQDS